MAVRALIRIRNCWRIAGIPPPRTRRNELEAPESLGSVGGAEGVELRGFEPLTPSMRNLGPTVSGGHSGEFAAFLGRCRPMPATVVAANFCCQHLARTTARARQIACSSNSPTPPAPASPSPKCTACG